MEWNERNLSWVSCEPDLFYDFYLALSFAVSWFFQPCPLFECAVALYCKWMLTSQNACASGWLLDIASNVISRVQSHNWSSTLPGSEDLRVSTQIFDQLRLASAVTKTDDCTLHIFSAMRCIRKLPAFIPSLPALIFPYGALARCGMIQNWWHWLI